MTRRVNYGYTKEHHDRTFWRMRSEGRKWNNNPKTLWERFESEMVKNKDWDLYIDLYEYLAGHEK